MAGDKLDIFGASYYPQGSSNYSQVPLMTVLESLLVASSGGAVLGKNGFSASDLAPNALGIESFLVLVPIVVLDHVHT